ncbi:MAG: hypothetical protein U0T69_11100 [Chitinophagales bacterium]
MKRFVHTIVVITTIFISCTKNSNRSSGDCNDCKWIIYDRDTKTNIQTAGYDDWLSDPYKQVFTYCHWLDSLKISYPNDTMASGDSIIYTCH